MIIERKEYLEKLIAWTEWIWGAREFLWKKWEV